MKHCPKCKSEVDENFELCWNCNYSFTDKKIVHIKDPDISGTKDIDCLRCKTPMTYSGNYKFHEGPKLGIMGNFFEFFVNRESFDIYLCHNCGKVEFFSPKIE
jgi:hypothetical protein